MFLKLKESVAFFLALIILLPQTDFWQREFEGLAPGGQYGIVTEPSAVFLVLLFQPFISCMPLAGHLNSRDPNFPQGDSEASAS